MSGADQTGPVTDAEASGWFADLSACNALVLAVSGGPDSTALCLLAARWRASLRDGPTLIAVTVDHGLRPEARREATAVKRFVASLGIAHRTMRWTGPKPATGLQEAARAARYRLLAAAARRVGARHILTAHTLDDQAETVLFRLARGSGLSGIAAMARVSPLPIDANHYSPVSADRKRLNGALLPPSPTRAGEGTKSLVGPEEAALVLVRPFLDVAKARLIATLTAAGIPYADDSSNRDPRFARPRLRAVMPALAAEGLTPVRLAQFALRVRRADAAIAAAVDTLAEKLVPFLSWSPSGAVSAIPPVRSLPLADWLAAPAEIRLRLLGRLIAASGDEGPVELGKLERCEQALTKHVSGDATFPRFRRTLAGAVVTVNGDRLTVARAPPRRRLRTLTDGAIGVPTTPGSIHQPLAK